MKSKESKWHSSVDSRIAELTYIAAKQSECLAYLVRMGGHADQRALDALGESYAALERIGKDNVGQIYRLKKEVGG